MDTQVKYLTILPEQAGQRIDNFLITLLKGVPKSHIYRLLRSGQVRVNKGRKQVSYRLETDDKLRIPPVRTATRDKPNISEYWQRTFTQAILYEDEHIIALDKPAGIAVHGGDAVNVGVIEVMRALRPQCKALELVHRLDKDTSGCLLLAKKRSVLKTLHEQFRQHQIDKRYLALVEGDWPESCKRIDAALNKNILKSGERIAIVSEQGKPSSTLFAIKQKFKQATLVEAQPLTGRMHQIRAHAAHAGHPIAGDRKYSNKAFEKTMSQLGCQRLCLHAHSIRITLENNDSTITAALPEDFAAILKHLPF